ncbi:MAG TPA: hypothetical protein VIY72_14440 [Acidimicrobiales bacterium]
MVVLAELEIFCSRPHAPTRRVALGDSDLPCEPPPGFGGILLGGVVAAHVAAIDPDLIPDLYHLTRELEAGRRVAQPRLRYRLQVDTIGLNSVRHRLVGEGERLSFDFDHRCAPAQQVLGAVYAAGRLDPLVRPAVMASLRRAIGWTGPVGDELIASLSGVRTGAVLSRAALENPLVWALDLLGFPAPDPAAGAPTTVTAAPPAKDVMRRFREMLRDAHPDHGASAEGAAQRIAELTEARRILTGR